MDMPGTSHSHSAGTPAPLRASRHLDGPDRGVDEQWADARRIRRQDARRDPRALLALLVEGGFGGNFLDAGLFPVLDNMTVHVRDGGDGVATALAEGEIVRPGSRRAVARGMVVDADDPSRLLAFAHIGYWMIQPRDEYMLGGGSRSPPATSGGVCHRASRSSTRWTCTSVRAPAYASLRPYMPACRRPKVACTAAPTNSCTRPPPSAGWCGHRQRSRPGRGLLDPVPRAGLQRAFVATASVLSRSRDDLLCQVELIDHGADDRIRSLSSMRIPLPRRLVTSVC